MVQKYLLSQYLLRFFFPGGNDAENLNPNNDATDIATDACPDSGTGIASTCAFKNISFNYYLFFL